MTERAHDDRASGGSERGTRIVMTIAAALAAVLGTAWVFLFGLAIGMGTCGGDGGTPYADPGSPAAGFCDGPAYGLWVLVPTIAGGLLLFGYARGVATRRYGPFAFALVGGAVLLTLFAVPFVLPQH